MAYEVIITSSDGNVNSYSCSGASDAEALAEADAVVRAKGDPEDPGAIVTVEKDGLGVGSPTTVGEVFAKGA